MKTSRFPTRLLIAAFFTLIIGQALQVYARDTVTFEYSAEPGLNYEKAAFRLWVPENVREIRAIVILVPGSNGDGRPMIEDPVWQKFASQHELALVGCWFTDKSHELAFIEEYVDVSRGSGQALLDALEALAGQSGHPELVSAPLLLWGMSAGGEFNYEFVAWKPERVTAFVVNKGGIYYSALVPEAARKVPGLLFMGEKDLESRTKTITGLFALNRRCGALWALVEEPNTGHEVGRSRNLALLFFEDVLALRLPQDPSKAKESAYLRPISMESGFIGDLRSGTFQKQNSTNTPVYPGVWLPGEPSARAWQMLINDVPFGQ